MEEQEAQSLIANNRNIEQEAQNIVANNGNIELAERGLVAKATTATPVEEVTVDEAIEGYIGSLGISQLLHVVLVSLAWMFDSQNTMVTIFSDVQPSGWRCKSSNSNSSWCNNSTTAVCGLDPGTWEWVGGNSSSTISEWSLICHRKFLAAVPASFFFLGSLFGCAVYGYLADLCLGRKRTLLLSCILTSITAFATSLSSNIWMYALLRFANGFARSGIGICCLVLSTEVVGHKWRGQVGQCGFIFFTVGFLSLPVIAYPTRNSWRNLYRIISLLPLCYSLLLLPFISESPRWLLVRGRNKEALDVLKTFAKQNGKQLPENLSLVNASTSKVENESLWSTPWAAKRMVLLMIAGYGVGFVYYGVQLNVENLNFNIYFTVALNAAMEIPVIFIGSLLLSFTNRRLLFSHSAFVAGVSCILCIIFTHREDAKANESGSWGQLSLEAISFMAASMAFDVLYIYCVELFPTNVRNFAVSLLRQALMLGASMAPLVVVVGRFSPVFSFLAFGVLSVSSGVLSLWLPETRNAPLYDTLKQQEQEEKPGGELNGSDLEQLESV